MSRGRGFYTVMIVPDDNERTVSIRLHKNVVRSMVLFLILVGISLLIFVAFWGRIGLRLQLVQELNRDKAVLVAEKAQLVKYLGDVRRLEVLAEYLSTVMHEGMPKDTTFALPESTVASAQKSTALSYTPNNNVTAGVADVPSIPPVEGFITRNFQVTGSGQDHSGVDIAAATGTPIRATAAGVVTSTVVDGFYGNLVIVRHNGGYETRYAHCSQVLVKQGDAVSRGQTIALVGTTGRSTAPHLHYEITKDNRSMDPKQYMSSMMYE